MWAVGTSKVLSWRWAPCVALAVGACGFAAFAMLVIPERIGDVPMPSPGDAGFRLDGSLASARSGSESASGFSDSGSSSSKSAAFSSLPSHQGAARSAANVFPKRGFTPPLERPEPPPPPPPPVVAQQPVLDVQPPVPAVQVPPPPDQAAQPQADPQSASASAEQAVRNTD